MKNDIQNILIYSDKLASFEYSENHPFKPSRAKQLLDLLNRYSLIFEPNQKIIEPEPLKEELLYLFHDREYIELLKTFDKGKYTIEMYGAGLGTEDNPVIHGIYEFSVAASGGTYQGAMMLLNNEALFVFNPLGGFHHAGRNHAEGFCYINDIAITISDLVRKGQRVVYIDIDVHHGNAVQDAFYDSDRVFTISLHESGKSLYPWSGFEDGIGMRNGRGYNINIPLLRGTDDEVYLYAFESIVPPLVKKFNPDIVCVEIGGDAHREDPLAHLNLTSNGYIKVVNMIKDFSPKLLALGGGGYNVFKTAALWALAWAAICGIEPKDNYAGLVGGMMYGPETESGSLQDEPFVLTGEEKKKCFKHAKTVVRFIQELLFPLHGLKI
jgi:acetoin utilization protein AcuC